MALARKSALVCVALLVVSVTARPVLGQNSNIVTINYPAQVRLTEVREINNVGEMVGRYIDTNNVLHAFTLNNGVFTNIDVSGATATAGWGINDSGDVVGRYYDPGLKRNHGFLLHNGSYTIIDPPGSTSTLALGVNNLGQIVGEYDDSAGNLHGFLLSNGVYTTIDFPGSAGTEVIKTNNFGVAVGDYFDANGNVHGFLLQNGVFTPFDVPGAPSTQPYGINDGGQVVGGYVTSAAANANELGFELSGGNYTTINFAVATGGNVVVEDINNQGQEVGTYLDSAGIWHGFVTAKGPFFYAADPIANDIQVFDSSSNLLLTSIPLATGAAFLTASPDQKQVYSTAFGNVVSVIDTATNTVVANIPVGNGASSLAFTPDGAFAYVANQFDNTVSVVDTVKQSVATTITGIGQPNSVVITPDGQSVYVTDVKQLGSVTVIATATNTVKTVIPNVASPQWMAISPDGSSVYVASAPGPAIGSAVVISTATNTVVANIPVGKGPINPAFSPDGSLVYIINQVDSTLSIISTATKTVASTIPSGTTPTPGWVNVSPDGSSLYVNNLNTIDVLSTLTHNVTATIPDPQIYLGAAIFLTSSPTSQVLTQALSPTAQNVFNFGPHAYKNQYPAGTNFAGVNMTVTAQQLTQAQFKALVSGSFPTATCIIYAGQGGDCTNYQVFCTDINSNVIACPSAAAPTIDVTTSFDTSQPIFNPGFVRRPTGSAQFENIFTSIAAQRVDPTVKGRTTGFSDFIAVDLGTSNAQGAANFAFLSPMRPADPRTFSSGAEIEVQFSLTSISNSANYVSDAQAGMSIVMIADGNGNPLVKEVLTLPPPAFYYSNERNSYRRELEFEDYAPGTYVLTVYGNAFPAQQVQFTIVARPHRSRN